MRFFSTSRRASAVFSLPKELTAFSLMTTSSDSTGQKYDNQGQYSRNGILRYEKIFGEGYVSTGGPATTKRLCAILGSALQPGARVLDVGSGLGGAAFDLARDYGVDVTGIDLAPEMVDITMERVAASGMPNSVRFQIADILTAEFDQPFDIIWSRDALMHIPDKERLFTKIHSLLKPGGHLVITDYARGAGQRSPEFESYATKTGYHLLDLESYGNVLRQVGFKTVKVEDATQSFDDIIEDEQTRLNAGKADFIKDFPESDWSYLMDRWEMKQGFIKNGDMKWGIFHAVK